MKKLLLSFSLITILILSSCKTEVNKTCSSCNGSGTITEKVTCDECKGRGQTKCNNYYELKRSSFQKFMSNDNSSSAFYYCHNGIISNGYRDGTCSACNGTGRVDCYKCNGYGTISKEKSCYSCSGSGSVKKEVWVWETW